MQFPDERGYELSQDGTDLIRPGCSIGFNRILGQIKEWAGVDNKPRWHMFLVNGATVFRNNYEPNKTLEQIHQDFLSDCEMLTRYLEAYMTIVGQPNQRIPVVVYIPDYHTLPKTIVREPGVREIEMGKMFARMAQRIYSLGPRLTSQGDFTDRWILPCGRQAIPEREITSWVHKSVMNRALGSFKLHDPICMITHCAVDLHIHRRLANVDLLESHTARIKPYKLFGTKLCHDKVGEQRVMIPFTVFTHRLFGDPVHIKPMVTGRNRTKIKEMAITNHWMRRTDAAIFSDVSKVIKIPFKEFETYTF